MSIDHASTLYKKHNLNSASVTTCIFESVAILGFFKCWPKLIRWRTKIHVRITCVRVRVRMRVRACVCVYPCMLTAFHSIATRPINFV